VKGVCLNASQHINRLPSWIPIVTASWSPHSVERTPPSLHESCGTSTNTHASDDHVSQTTGYGTPLLGVHACLHVLALSNEAEIRNSKPM
jgi:hypothetical protein